MRFLAPVKKHWLGPVSIVLPPFGPPLGSARSGPSIAPEAKDEEDPDYEDFAFFAGLSEAPSASEAIELEEVPPPAQQGAQSSREAKSRAAPSAPARPLAFRRDEEAERKRKLEEAEREAQRQEEEARRRRKRDEEEQERERERERQRKEEAVRKAEEERERRARLRQHQEEEKKRSEQERLETVKKRAKEIEERQRQAEEEFVANSADNRKKALKIDVRAPSALPEAAEPAAAAGSLSALLRFSGAAGALPPAAGEPAPKRSRSPRRTPGKVETPKEAKPVKAKEAKEAKVQQEEEEPAAKESAKEEPVCGSAEEPVGWLPEGHPCDACKKQVSAFGGVFCGRRKVGGIPLAGGNMSIQVTVGLLSGKTATVTADLDEEVATLKRRAETALGVGRGRLVGSSGTVLDANAPIKHTSLQDGDFLTLHINRVQVQASREASTATRGHGAFAAILGDGTVVTWGDDHNGGDSSAVQDQLRNVRQIQASSTAFAAILADGSVVTWGDSECGGDSSAAQDQLKNVQQIQANGANACFADYGAFAAILADETVVTWGDACSGGDSSAVQDQLRNVQQIRASNTAFAAILADGSVVTWGDSECGGDSSAVQLKNVRQIQANFGATAEMGAFAAILADGTVVTWGFDQCGGDSSAVQDRLRNVKQIQASRCAFAAILGDGSVVTWGADQRGGDSRAVQEQLKNVQQIQASDFAFAAILGDGSVVTWGDADHGGDSSTVQDQLKDVQQIQASRSAFAAILSDGSVVTWGDAKWWLRSCSLLEVYESVLQRCVVWQGCKGQGSICWKLASWPTSDEDGRFWVSRRAAKVCLQQNKGDGARSDGVDAATSHLLVRTTKREFESLGSEAWWMHEACMDEDDLRDYYNDDQGEAAFAWE
eukprot:s55_g28.t2